VITVRVPYLGKRLESSSFDSVPLLLISVVHVHVVSVQKYY
jgi:hypothetical protein